MLAGLADNLVHTLLWSLIATAAMTGLLQASQGLGFSRLSLFFLVGTFFTSRRTYANLFGFLVYAVGGWLFALIYVALFLSLEYGSWWLGLIFGVFHAAVLLTVGLPLVSYAHPRMANEYDGPVREQRLEPPGFLGLNYGYGTPLSVVTAQAAYGMVLGLCFQLTT